MSTFNTYEMNFAGKRLSLETARLAGQANGAVTVRYGDTVVLATVCLGKDPRPGIDFLPLTVDYEERLYAAGKIPGGFIRREGRPTEEAVLAARLTDRPIRPLLPSSWRNDVQIIITVLSVDQEVSPDMLAVIGASAALHISEMPFAGPVGACHVGYVNGEYLVNPTFGDLENSLFDVTVVSTGEAVIMLETGANEANEALTMQAIRIGHETNQDIIRLQEKLRQEHGKPKQPLSALETDPELATVVSRFADDKLPSALLQLGKSERERVLDDLQNELLAGVGDSYPRQDVIRLFDQKVKDYIRATLLQGKRVDGRSLTDVRPIASEVGLLPRTHGSALFTRGQTQVLSIATLGSKRQEQRLDGLGVEESKRFIHHYNFPPYSTGETKRVGTPGRREIGHGALARKALLPVLPDEDVFPYTIRLVSEVLSSNGSSSMASVCSSSLSLMDAGIPLKAAVSGVAMGLVTGRNGERVILTDIAGLEDAYGDMDFKIAGTANGITAIQMDTKLQGISLETIEKTLDQARDGRLFILGEMERTISSSRPEVSRYAPRMYKMKINPEKIGAVIGTGGKTIRSITEETKTVIDVEDDGTITIGSVDEAAANKAIEMITKLTKEIEVGEVYKGKVSRILSFGAMVEILPGKEGMVHISELADHRIATVEDAVKLGEEIEVKVIAIDNMGRVNLSRRALSETTPRPAGAQPDRSRDRRPPPHRFSDKKPESRQDDRKPPFRRWT
jgi:polyribonucleotide nucleotidyltransferase